jgi:hypothetical protein
MIHHLAPDAVAEAIDRSAQRSHDGAAPAAAAL